MKIFLVSLIFSVALQSCKKAGCTDELANNYDVEAKENNNSCTYDASAIFWINANTSTSYQNNNINELKVYVDDSFIGILGTNSSLLQAPSCETGGGVNHYEDLNTNPDRIALYRVTYVPFTPPGVPAADEITEAQGSIKLEGGKCISFQIQ